MLVLSRPEKGRIRVVTPDGCEIWIQVLEIRKGTVRLGIEAEGGGFSARNWSARR